MLSKLHSDGPLTASLFSGSGIGDLGFRAAGLRTLAMCEIESDRSALAQTNFPECIHFSEDIRDVKAKYVEAISRSLHATGEELFLISCTAPCQGMSKSGQGTLLKNVREGKRPKLDPRNALVLPALQIIKDLRPLWVMFENVPEMRSTLIEDENGDLRSILSIIASTLGDAYVGDAYDVEFADYGVPQRRQRLISVFTRDAMAKRRFAEGLPFIPPTTHSSSGMRGKAKWISVVEALKDFHSLDSIDSTRARSESIPFHYVPVLDPKKYEWIRHAKPGSSAFDNQCINPDCLHDGNVAHGNSSNAGINQSKKDTPLYCTQCGSLMPRPYIVQTDGKKRIMSGFTSAYKRMNPDMPSPALTRNLSYPCSDNKVHPYQNRVLSLAEAMKLQTISKYDYRWEVQTSDSKNAKTVTDSLIRLVIGESVPPLFFELLGLYIQNLSRADDLPLHYADTIEPLQLSLL